MLDAEQTAILDTYKRVQQAMIDKDIETLDELYLDGATFRHMSGKVQIKEEFFGEEIRTFGDIWLNWSRRGLKQ